MLRPHHHFTPQKGWMNDPNGPVFYKGEYHLFFQHDPDSLTWNTMHWGHARSKDLVNWEHLPIALFPDEIGVMYSGSAFVDAENVSGFGSKEEPALLLFYTAHDMKTLRESQCLAWSTDGLSFHKFEKNPIIAGCDHTPARDPQVFRNPVSGGYSMVLTREKVAEFYHSTDLLSWEKTGEFALPSYALQGMIECPCMFHAEWENETDITYGNGEETTYVLMLSMDVPETEFGKFPKDAAPHKRVMQYFVGSFDGSAFRVDERQQEVLLVDHGPDFYAGTIFSNVKETILLAWLGDFSEGARRTPTEQEGFRGILSFPRKLTLCRTEKGWRLHHDFVPEVPEVRTDDAGERILEDGCVIETISKDGLRAVTSYR